MKNPKNNRNGIDSVLTNPIAPATVGFRLPNEDDRRELARRALKAGLTAHELARAYVVDALHSEDDLPKTHEALVSLYNELTELRGDIARAVEVLLLSLEKDTKKDIEKWVNDNLRRE